MKVPQIRGLVKVTRRADFHRKLQAAAEGRARRHQLWLGPPGKGKTTGLHRFFRNTVGYDLLPRLAGRVDAPIYGGTVKPAKLFFRGWQHHLDPFLIWNDLAIPRDSDEWLGMILQFCEHSDTRTIRWDLKTERGLGTATSREITNYLKERGLWPRFLEENRRAIEQETREEDESPPTEPDRDAKDMDGRDPRFASSLPEIDRFEVSRDRSDDERDREEDRPVMKREPERSKLILPARYETSSTVIVCANNLGSIGWEPVYSRLRCYSYEPVIDDLIDELDNMGTHGDKRVPEAIMMVVKSAHRSGELLDMDLRTVLDAVEDFEIGEPWEDALRASFVAPAMVEILEYAQDVTEWLAEQEKMTRTKQETIVGTTFTDRDLGQAVGSLRGEQNKERRNRVLDYLASQGWIERHAPPAHVRPGVKGRRTRWSFSVIRVEF